MRILCTVLFTAGSCFGQQQDPAAEVTPRALAAEYDGVWQEFVRQFRSETETAARVELIEAFSTRANDLLRPHLKTDRIRRVLPAMAGTRLLELQSSFLGIVSGHPEPSVQATALLHFAEYLGNNRRLEECDVALAHLKSKYGELKFRRTTFARAADEAGYYFRNLAVGCRAPATTGQDVDGELFSLSDYRGKVVMLRFWGDWCPACRAMYPFEREVTQAYRNRRFALIGVNSDSRDKCRRVQDDSRLTWRSFWDGGDTQGPIATLYQVEDWPRIIIIDAEGVIRMNARGLDQKYVRSLLDRLIREAEQQGESDA